MFDKKPCPGCEAPYPWLVRVHPVRLLFTRYYVECWKCHYCGKTKIGKERAVKAWNRIARGERGYRKTGTMEQLFYIMEYFPRKRWGWVSGEQKSGKDV